MSTIETIKNHATYKAVVADSFGGVMYNVANRDKYDPEDVTYLLTTWDQLTECERGSAGGIMKGAIGFLKGD